LLITENRKQKTVSIMQQIILSGLGGQGILTITRVLAEAAATLGMEVITSETHGMAQRGGTVISMVKVGPFKGPLVPAGSADVGLFLHPGNLQAHGFYLKPGGISYVSTALAGDYRHLDAVLLASQQGLPRVSANLILLGYAAAQGGLFCTPAIMEQVIRDKTPAAFREVNLQAFRLGVAAAGESL
jgi:indolepyruvate ferredoxin oxidoreductase beta subunit